MNCPAVKVEGLSKEYVIGSRENGRETFREMLTSSLTAPFRRFQTLSGKGASEERIWALKDLCFEVAKGEVVGIIGHNGAGKSTLLKILSRITEPTQGCVEIRGRVASLLEVGTGFHSELTGRENIYLNGAILGMSRREIDRKFDEIIDFADIERFLDTPVKRYSSGMYVRLAFAVAAHLEPDILLVDEVLAVGDVEFQKRCLGKMSEVAQGGRTVVFVSHNMGAIRRLTQRCIILEKGHVMIDAPVQDAIELYLKQASEGLASGDFVRDKPRPTDVPFYINRVVTRRKPDGDPVNQFDCDHSIFICIEYTVTWPVPGLFGYLQLQRLDGTVIYEGDSTEAEANPFDRLVAGTGMVYITIPERILGAGTYQIYLSFASAGGPHIDVPGIVGEFNIDNSSTRRGNRRNGYLSMKLLWQTRAERQ